ncbi:MAG: hypothetical protein ACK5ME_03430 [Parahaliea sp.]
MSNRMIIGVDLAKTSFAVVMLNSADNELSRKTVKRQHYNKTSTVFTVFDGA